MSQTRANFLMLIASLIWGTAFVSQTTGIGTIGTLLHLIVAFVVSRMTPEPPAEIQELVENIRIPSGVGEALDH